VLCPFLRDATVTFCRQAPAAKALPLEAIDQASSRCNGPDHASCPYAPKEAGDKAGRCPALEERQVRYCVAASTAKPVPALTMLPSRCSTDAYRHCALYLDRAGARPAGAAHGTERPAADVDGIEVPLELAYCANHLWADRGTDGSCTIGVDAFLVRAIGSADRVTFVSTWPGTQPFAVLSVAGLELPLAFPYPLERTVINYALRVEPKRLATDPYGAGWLFEGRWVGDVAPEPTSPGRLVRGAAAVFWMRREVERLSVLVHDLIGERAVNGMLAAADGGTFAAGVARALRREDALHLFSGFFPVPPVIWSERCEETS
jgi:glycine cleavage system H lipoate-binding protein